MTLRSILVVLGIGLATATALAAEPTGANVALDENGGFVYSISGEYGAGPDGGRLVDGRPEPAWAWRGSALRELPLDIVISFYKRQSALVASVVIEVPLRDRDGKPNGNAPKDVEVWTSGQGPDGQFERAAAATLSATVSPQMIAFRPIEARAVRVRVRSVQGSLWALSRVEIGEIGVLEAQQAGYQPLLARHADIAEWRNSPRRAAQRGINWLQPAAMQWQKDHECFGCHIQAQAVMGLAIAKKNDYVVSDRVLNDLNAFTELQQKADGTYVREDTGEPSTPFAAMGLAYWDDFKGVARNPKLIKAVDWLVAKQRPAGNVTYGEWQACGVRAVQQGAIMTTANSLAGFERAYVETHDTRYRDAADRARAWIAAANPVTTQDKVFKILTLARHGTPESKAAVQRIVDRLLQEQHASGGWRECIDPSTPNPNPFSTGQVLYAFKLAGVSVAAAPFVRGVKYLLAAQNADGSWPADSRAFHTMGAPHAPTMWAIIGLAGSFSSAPTGSVQITTDAPLSSAANTRPSTALGAGRNVEIVLDLSGSMKLPLGSATRIAAARHALRDVLTQIPDDVNVGLRVYAHRYGARQKETCTDSELVSAIARIDRRRILSIVDRLQPRGETPLVYSILQARGDLQAVGGGSLVVITDGEETCGGDPVTAAQQLKDAGFPLVLNIVGFTLTGAKVKQELTAFAEATGGRYYGAEDGEALGRAVASAALARTPYTIFDEKGAKVAGGFAGAAADTLPAGTYNVVVEASGQRLTESVTLTPGAAVVLKIVQRNGRYELNRFR